MSCGVRMHPGSLPVFVGTRRSRPHPQTTMVSPQPVPLRDRPPAGMASGSLGWLHHLQRDPLPWLHLVHSADREEAPANIEREEPPAGGAGSPEPLSATARG